MSREPAPTCDYLHCPYCRKSKSDHPLSVVTTMIRIPPGRPKGETSVQTITPYLLYEDTAAAIDWLSRAFGFEERLRFTDEGGTVTHAELTLGDGAVYLGYPGPDYRSPKRHGTSSHLVHVYVEDIETHHARA